MILIPDIETSEMVKRERGGEVEMIPIPDIETLGLGRGDRRRETEEQLYIP